MIQHEWILELHEKRDENWTFVLKVRSAGRLSAFTAGRVVPTVTVKERMGDRNDFRRVLDQNTR